LINGAGGGVGSIAVQIAKAYGAHVTGVDSGQKLEMVRALGADRCSTTAVPSRKASVAVLRKLLEAGKLMPTIDRSYALSEVGAAMRHLCAGDARGKIVITP
jgi:NADPH:quinone reductase-like Zn-dependent oxidoreductase